MKAYFATLIAPSAVVLSSYGCALANSSTSICKFETGVVVIDPVGPDGAVTVEVASQRHSYALNDEKMVPQDTGLPTLLFQPRLKRWKSEPNWYEESLGSQFDICWGSQNAGTLADSID